MFPRYEIHIFAIVVHHMFHIDVHEIARIFRVGVVFRSECDV
jgi:hypothetical protein